jgi:hypothetical protein
MGYYDERHCPECGTVLRAAIPITSDSHGAWAFVRYTMSGALQANGTGSPYELPARRQPGRRRFTRRERKAMRRPQS